MLGGVLPYVFSDFDELRPPAKPALRVTFDVIYPAAPLKAVFMDIRITFFDKLRQPWRIRQPSLPFHV